MQKYSPLLTYLQYLNFPLAVSCTCSSEPCGVLVAKFESSLCAIRTPNILLQYIVYNRCRKKKRIIVIPNNNKQNKYKYPKQGNLVGGR